jgi:hypothetical protein
VPPNRLRQNTCRGKRPLPSQTLSDTFGPWCAGLCVTKLNHSGYRYPAMKGKLKSHFVFECVSQHETSAE